MVRSYHYRRLLERGANVIEVYEYLVVRVFVVLDVKSNILLSFHPRFCVQVPRNGD